MTPAPLLLLFFDYVDPLSYLVERSLGAVEEALGVAVERRPFELRPPPAPLLDPDDPAWRRYWSEAEAAARREGVALRQPSLVPWTRKAHELVVHAGEHGVRSPVHRALYEAFLLEGRDIGRVDVLAELARSRGLPWTETRAVLDVDKHAASVAGGRAVAERLGVRGVPTLLAGDRSLEGLHDPDTLRAFLDPGRPSTRR